MGDGPLRPMALVGWPTLINTRTKYCVGGVVVNRGAPLASVRAGGFRLACQPAAPTFDMTTGKTLTPSASSPGLACQAKAASFQSCSP